MPYGALWRPARRRRASSCARHRERRTPAVQAGREGFGAHRRSRGELPWMIRGGGAPNKGMAPEPLFRLDSPPRSFAADAHGCIMVRAPRGPPDTRLRRDDPRARWRAPLGLVRNRLPAEPNRRNAAAELEP